jgi:hypothetical protein
MKKLDKTKTKPAAKTNPLDAIPKRIEKYVELYDSPLMHDPLSNSFKTEKQIKHEAMTQENKTIDTLNKYEDKPDIPKKKLPYLSATDKYNMYKATASPAERKEFEQIEENAKPLKERKVYKAKMAALDAELKKNLLTPIPTTITQPEPKNTFLADLVAERRDPDLDKGLGQIIKDVDLKKF